MRRFMIFILFKLFEVSFLSRVYKISSFFIFVYKSSLHLFNASFNSLSNNIFTSISNASAILSRVSTSIFVFPLEILVYQAGVLEHFLQFVSSLFVFAV